MDDTTLVALLAALAAIASTLIFVLPADRSQPLSVHLGGPPTIVELLSAVPASLFRPRVLDSKRTIPLLQLSMVPQPWDSQRAKQVQALHAVSGLPPPGDAAACAPLPLPLLLPAAVAGRLQLGVLLHPRFPLSVLGAVVVRHTASMHAPVKASALLAYTTDLAAHRRTPKGDTEVDLRSRARDADGGLVWEGVQTVSVLNPNRSAVGESSGNAENEAAEAPPDADWRVLDVWDLPSGLGWQYAKLSGDFNPIHLSAVSARLFGFKSTVAHGLALVSRAVASLQRSSPDAAWSTPSRQRPVCIQSKFLRPTFIPGQVALLTCASEEEASVHFRIVPGGGALEGLGRKAGDSMAVASPPPKVLIEGRLWIGANPSPPAAQ